MSTGKWKKIKFQEVLTTVWHNSYFIEKVYLSAPPNSPYILNGFGCTLNLSALTRWWTSAWFIVVCSYLWKIDCCCWSKTPLKDIKVTRLNSSYAVFQLKWFPTSLLWQGIGSRISAEYYLLLFCSASLISQKLERQEDLILRYLARAPPGNQCGATSQCLNIISTIQLLVCFTTASQFTDRDHRNAVTWVTSCYCDSG